MRKTTVKKIRALARDRFGPNRRAYRALKHDYNQSTPELRAAIREEGRKLISNQ